MELVGAVNSTGRTWRVDSLPASDVRYLTVEDEIVKIEYRSQMGTGPYVRVTRGVEGTTAASHADGTELTPAYVVGASEGGGGGGDVPSHWTVDADEASQILRYQAALDPDPIPTAGIQVQSGTDDSSGVQIGVTEGDPGDITATIQAGAKGGGAASLALLNWDDPDGAVANMYGNGSIQLFTVADVKAIEAWDAAGSVLRFGLLPAGQPVVGVTAAPADGDLSAGQCALWFDQTDGAAKLKIKGKSANGTVVAGEVALS